MTHFSAALHNFCENENRIWDANKLSFPWPKKKKRRRRRRMLEEKKKIIILSLDKKDEDPLG